MSIQKVTIIFGTMIHTDIEVQIQEVLALYVLPINEAEAFGEEMLNVDPKMEYVIPAMCDKEVSMYSPTTGMDKEFVNLKFDDYSVMAIVSHPTKKIEDFKSDAVEVINHMAEEEEEEEWGSADRLYDSLNDIFGYTIIFPDSTDVTLMG